MGIGLFMFHASPLIAEWDNQPRSEPVGIDVIPSFSLLSLFK